jgi:hypothetical protein
MKKYPDMTELFALKEARRRKLANLPITEKMEIAERLQEIALQSPSRAKGGVSKKPNEVVAMRPKKSVARKVDENGREK